MCSVVMFATMAGQQTAAAQPLSRGVRHWNDRIVAPTDVVAMLCECVSGQTWTDLTLTASSATRLRAECWCGSTS